MDETVERAENNFINIYNKFDILDKKSNNYHIKIDEINDMIDLIISNEYNKIYKTYYPIKIMIYHKIDFLYIVKL